MMPRRITIVLNRNYDDDRVPGMTVRFTTDMGVS